MKAQDFEKFASINEFCNHLRAEGFGAHLTNQEMRRIVAEKIPKESVFQKDILEYLKKTLPADHPDLCVKAFKLQAGPYMQGGLPDVWALIRKPGWDFGRVFCFEVKRPFVGKLSDLQAETLKELEQAGAVTCVVSFVSEAKSIVERTLDLGEDTNVHTKWHPASEPPKEAGEYIVMCSGGTIPTALVYSIARGGWYEFNDNDYDYEFPSIITHWCHMPQPPKGVG